MRRRAGRALAAALVLVAVGATCAIGAGTVLGAPAASAATATDAGGGAVAGPASRTEAGSVTAGQQASQPVVSVAITGMTPQEAVAGSVITVTGTVTNNSAKPARDLSVQLLSSATPITSETYLQPGAAELAGLANAPVPGGTMRIRGEIQPRAVEHWTIQVKGSKIGMSAFGVYPVEAQVLDTATQLQLDSALTYLPYTPPSKGPFSSTIPHRARISWVWPLLGTPLPAGPGQSVCQGPHARALASSLSSTGRLGQLVAAGEASAGTADTYGSATGVSRSGRAASRAAAAEAVAARTRPTQNLAGLDSVTWAIDPALLWDVQALARCTASEPQWARTASAWLTQLEGVSAAEPMFVTPYADPNAGSLIGARRTGDVTQSFSIGRTIASRILRRNLSPVAGGQAGSSSIYWPPDGTATYETLETLAGNDGVRTVLLSSEALRAGSATVSRYLNGIGGYFSLVLASQSLTQQFSSDSSTGTSAFGSGQQFLAETALLAQQDPGQPIVVAPPARWRPARGVATSLLADTASASWLSPASLTSLTSAKGQPLTPSDALDTRNPTLSNNEASLLASVDSAVQQLELLTGSGQTYYQAVATDESSAWHGLAKVRAMRRLSKLADFLASQEQDVRIVAEKRVTLGGLRGTVPVSIANSLNYPVEVQLAASAPAGFKVVTAPSGVITIQAHDALTVRLHVTATGVGSTTVSMKLLNKKGQPLSSGADATKMTVQATQVGVLGAIVCAIALGIFLIAYAARAVRRGRPDGADAPDDPEPAGTEPDDTGPAGAAGDGQRPPAEGSAADESTAHAEPDTVMTEQRKLGAAGTPGP